jgi:hypothetical protein
MIESARAMRFRIAALLLTTALVAILLKFVLLLGRSSVFYLTPATVFVVAYFCGRRIQRPAFCAVLAANSLGLYAFTIPLVEMLLHAIHWPAGTLKIYEWYCVPFYAWADQVKWFFTVYKIWSTYCDMVPGFAILTLSIVAIMATVSGIYYDRLWVRRFASRLSLTPSATDFRPRSAEPSIEPKLNLP